MLVVCLRRVHGDISCTDTILTAAVLIRFASVEHGLFPLSSASVCTDMNVGRYMTAVDEYMPRDGNFMKVRESWHRKA